jgi:hypothetical protein
MRNLMLATLVATLFTLSSAAFAQWSPEGQPVVVDGQTYNTTTPVTDGIVTTPTATAVDTTVVVVAGSQGPQGNPGMNGKNGNNGYNGRNGNKGRRGYTGARGTQGPQGPKGDKGDNAPLIILSTSTPTGTNQQSGGNPMDYTWIWIVGIAAVATIAVIAIILTADRNKNQDNNAVVIARQATAQAQANQLQQGIAHLGQFTPVTAPGQDVSISGCIFPNGGGTFSAHARAAQQPQQVVVQQQAAAAQPQGMVVPQGYVAMPDTAFTRALEAVRGRPTQVNITPAGE